MTRYYTGVGSRKIPMGMWGHMADVGGHMAENGYILRSGGAKGSDHAFEAGCRSRLGEHEIFRPEHATPEAIRIAMGLHPRPDLVKSDYVARLHGRNVFQILGPDLKMPSRFVICWTPDGCESHETRTIKTGGTGTAISVASTNGIPVINMFNDGWEDRLLEVLK